MTENHISVWWIVKTTIEIPEALYKKAKIRAIETGQSLKQIVVKSLMQELEGVQVLENESRPSFLQKRQLLPAYEAALKAGAFSSGTDSTVMLSDDRISRDDALL